jgi:HlyD family secretion protein
MAQLDASDWGLKRQEALAALALAQAQQELLQAGNREEDIQRASNQVLEARATAQATRADFQRIEQVYAQKSVTQKQFDDAKSHAERTAAALAAAEQNFVKIRQGSRAEEIRIAQAQVQLAQARLEQTEKGLADCRICAPLDGVVTTRHREPGEYVSPGAGLLTISKLEEVWLTIYIPESRLAGIKLGQTARVKADGDRALYTGTVTFISPEAEFTPKNVQTPDERAKLVYRVKIALKNPKGIFKPGMPADGFLRDPRNPPDD